MRKLAQTLCALVLTSALFADTGNSVALRKDQAHPVCNKRELKHWKADNAALSDADRQWMEIWSHKESKRDYNKDGIEDMFEIVSTQYVRECNIATILPLKEVNVMFTDGKTGRRQLWNWNGGVADNLSVDIDKRNITITGFSYDRSRWSKTLHYER